MSELTVTINGEHRRVPGPTTAHRLLEHLGLDPRAVIVELNEKIIRRPLLGDTAIDDGDRIEVVHFVGGG